MNKVKWITALWIPLLFTGCVSLSTPKAPATVTIVPTRQMLPSPTNTLTMQSSQTLTRTTTNTPKLPPTEQAGDCRFPCWWGITPGVTTWEDALIIIENQKIQAIETEIHTNSTISRLPKEQGYVWVYRRDDGIINWIGISSKPLDGVQYFNLLTEFGEPSDVYLFAYQHFQGDYPPASVIMYYAGEGILAEYEFAAKLDEITNTITVCPTPTSQELWLDPKGTEYSRREISQTVLGNGPDVMKIDEATSISKQDFYALYKDENQTKCFETPASLWP